MSVVGAGARNRSQNEPALGGRLVGWLISYGLDESGFTFEIREGRSFISSEPGKDKFTLCINDTSISSPHLVIGVNKRNKILVQDIFSQHGSYITRAESDSEVSIDGTVELQHGDWLRIGEKTRFQVCLIDGVRS